MTTHRPQRRGHLLAAGTATACLVLAACSAEGGSDDTAPAASAAAGGSCDTLNVTEIVLGNYPNEQQQWQQDVAAEFEAETGVTLTYDTMANAGDQQTQIQTAVVSGTGPDVFTIGTTFAPVAYSTGAFRELSEEDWEAIGGRDRFFAEPLGISGPSEDSQIAVPFVMRPFAMVYNTEMFAAAGIESPPETWDEYIAIAEQLTDTEAGVYGTAFPYGDGFDPWKFIWMYTLQNGGQLVSEDLTTAQLASDEAVEATTDFFALLTESDGVDPGSVSLEGPQVQAAFAAGELAMAAMASPTWVPGLEEGVVAGSYAFAPHPTVPPGEDTLPEGGQPAGSIISGDMMTIADYTECADTALQYVAYMTSDEVQQRYYEIFGSLPANQAAAEAIAAEDEVVAAFIEATAASVPTSFTGAWGNVQLGLQDAVQQSLPALQEGTFDVAAVSELLTEANATVQTDLDRQAEAAAGQG